jgi:hypothetical protein
MTLAADCLARSLPRPRAYQAAFFLNNAKQPSFSNNNPDFSTFRDVSEL